MGAYSYTGWGSWGEEGEGGAFCLAPRLCMRAAEPLLLGAASLEAPKSPLRRVQRSLEAPLSETDPLLHRAHLATLCA